MKSLYVKEEMTVSSATVSSHKGMPARGIKKTKALKIIAFLAPMLVFAILFVYYPFIRTVVYSLCAVNDKGDILRFVGLDNFSYVFGRNDFRKALINSITITFINVPATLILTISLALLANKKRRLSAVYETMFTLPMSISMSAACMIFKSMFSPTLGCINAYLGTNLGWFESRETALYTCIILTVWMGIGFDFLLFQSALRGIPKQIMEACELDGTGFLTRIFKIQIPLISPTIFYVLCTNTVLAMMTSGPMIIITQGGPSRSTTTLMYMMFASGYGSSNYSLAAVVSLTTFTLTFIFTILAFIYERKGVHYQ